MLALCDKAWLYSWLHALLLILPLSLLGLEIVLLYLFVGDKIIYRKAFGEAHKLPTRLVLPGKLVYFT
jgi:hypothetical protein